MKRFLSLLLLLFVGCAAEAVPYGGAEFTPPGFQDSAQLGINVPVIGIALAFFISFLVPSVVVASWFRRRSSVDRPVAPQPVRPQSGHVSGTTAALIFLIPFLTVLALVLSLIGARSFAWQPDDVQQYSLNAGRITWMVLLNAVLLPLIALLLFTKVGRRFLLVGVCLILPLALLGGLFVATSVKVSRVDHFPPPTQVMEQFPSDLVEVPVAPPLPPSFAALPPTVPPSPPMPEVMPDQPAFTTADNSLVEVTPKQIIAGGPVSELSPPDLLQYELWEFNPGANTWSITHAENGRPVLPDWVRSEPTPKPIPQFVTSGRFATSEEAEQHLYQQALDTWLGTDLDQTYPVLQGWRPQIGQLRDSGLLSQRIKATYELKVGEFTEQVHEVTWKLSERPEVGRDQLYRVWLGKTQESRVLHVLLATVLLMGALFSVGLALQRVGKIVPA